MTKRFAGGVKIVALSLTAQACVDLPQTAPFAEPPAEEEAKADQATCESLRVGSWNLRKLGFDAEKDVALIARILDTHFDLVGLLEIVWSEDDAVYAALVEALGPEWLVVRTQTPRPNLASPHAEYYAVAARRTRVAPCAEPAALHYVPDGDGSSESDARGLFLREPAYGCFRAHGASADDALVLGVYHALWGTGDPAQIAAEVGQVDLALAAMRRAFPDVPQLVLVGDFNLDGAALAPLTTAQDRTQGTGSTLDAQGNVSAHLYDHLLAASAAARSHLTADARVLDVRSEANSPLAFRDRVSDHLPIVAKLTCGGPED